MAHPVRPDEYVEINNFYTSTVYEKGAEVIRMLHTLLGAGALPARDGPLLRAPRRAGRRPATTSCRRCRTPRERPTASTSRSSGAGTRRPARRCCRCAGATTPRRARYTLDVAQRCPPTPGQPEKAPFHIPLARRPRRPGRPRPAAAPRRRAGQRRHDPRAAGDRRRRSSVPCSTDVPVPPVPSLLRGFSAPVQLEFDYTREDARALAAHDSDPVGRWDAAQRSFAQRDPRRGAGGTRPGCRWRSIARSSPSPSSCSPTGEQRSGADRAGAGAARARVPRRSSSRRSTSTRWSRRATSWSASSRARCAPAFAHGVASRRPAAPYAPDAGADRRAGARQPLPALPRRTLDDDGARALAVAQFDGADNMTDASPRWPRSTHSGAPRARGAVRALRGEVARRAAGARQVVRAAGDLAARRHAGARRGRCSSHPKFNARNPNRVRSLLAAFALSTGRSSTPPTAAATRSSPTRSSPSTA